MEDNKVTTIHITPFLLILAIIAIIIMGVNIYKLNNDKKAEMQKATELQAQVDSLNRTINNLQQKINDVYNIVNQTTVNNNSNEAENTNKATNPKNNYEGESFIGYYQLLNESYFSTSKYDSSKYTTLDLEIQLLSNGTAKIAYKLDDNGNSTSKQYNANYTVGEKLDMEIDGDYYRTLKLTYASEDAKVDEIISAISTDITYNPAPSSSEPKRLVMRGGAANANLMPHMINSSEIKYIK